jgi:hypothetical protein
MAHLLDTSILMRLANTSDPFYAVANRAVVELHRRGEVLHVTAQNFIEFRNVATWIPRMCEAGRTQDNESMSAGTPLRATLDPQRFSALKPCTEDHGIGAEDDEWGNNSLSSYTVAYSNGVIARRGDDAELESDPGSPPRRFAGLSVGRSTPMRQSSWNRSKRGGPGGRRSGAAERQRVPLLLRGLVSFFISSHGPALTTRRETRP